MQSKTVSAVEASANILTGFLISFVVWVLLVPLFWPNLATPVATSFTVVGLFTITSWLRSYLWRRFFANELHRKLWSLVSIYL